MRLMSKECVGAKCAKRCEKQPKTPAQRVLESPAVTEQKKERIRRFLVPARPTDDRDPTENARSGIPNTNPAVCRGTLTVGSRTATRMDVLFRKKGFD